MATIQGREEHTDWLLRMISEIVDHVEILSPVEYNEGRRYIPQSVSRFSGYIDYSLTPYWKEILNCFDVASPVREVAVMKGVQIAYTTALESIIFYLAGHVKTIPVMFATADRDLSHARMENNIIPMFQQSGMDIFRSADEDSRQKTGKTRDFLQWEGGGYMIPAGAKNSDRMRSISVLAMLMDEIDAWAESLKGGGNPVYLLKDRCAAYHHVRKILMGGTPLIKGSSHIEREFQRGDQRRYMVHCLKCGEAQALRWSGRNKDKGFQYGIQWDYTTEGALDAGSVRYACAYCGEGHQEHDKPRLFAESNAEWVPTATPVEPEIRSYHIPALLSPAGMQPWSKCVSSYLRAWDAQNNRVRDVEALQLFYNNTLGEPFEIMGAKISFAMVSGHRRAAYRRGEIPNRYISEVAPGPVCFLTCTVDVHHDNLRVAILGWTRNATCWLVDYHRLDDFSEAGCEVLESPAWAALREIIENRQYVADDGKRYNIAITLIDAGFANATVTEFCGQYENSVFPILGRDSYTKTQKIQEFAPFHTQAGTLGYRIHVDFYKDRIAPVLRRDWTYDSGIQAPYTFNAPVDTTDDELRELTREYRREKKQANGTVTHYWHRPHGAPNELWDLMVYGHCAVDIVAYSIFIERFQSETIEWVQFWDLVEGDPIFWAPQ